MSFIIKSECFAQCDPLKPYLNLNIQFQQVIAHCCIVSVIQFPENEACALSESNFTQHQVVSLQIPLWQQRSEIPQHSEGDSPFHL
jgi:hypothetical protein